MTEKRDVIRRLRLGQSIRQINRETGVHRTIVRELRSTAEQKGWLDAKQPLPTENAVTKAFTRNRKKQEHPLDRFEEKIKGWLKDKNSFLIIHVLLSQEITCSESTVRRYCHKRFPKLVKPIMLRPTLAGEVMEVDFGYLGITYDPQTKRKRKTYLFSARLRHSRYAYRQVVFNQKQTTFFRCHIHAFEYFRGVPEKVVPDNLKAAVVKASFEDPVINRVYQRLAIHYGFLISPCRANTPEHKGGVESDVKYVKKNFWPLFKEREKSLGHEIPYSEDIQTELDRWSREVAHVRTIKGVGRRPIDMFLEEERGALKQLPLSRWDIVTWATHKVHETWRIQHDRAFYSVPYQYIGETVHVYINSSTVEIYLGDEEIARHSRAIHKWQYVRNTLHAPPEPERYMQQTRERVLESAKAIGLPVERVANAIFSRKGIDGMRPARALLALRKKYGSQRLIAACARALCYDTPEYNTVKRILVNGLEALEITEAIDSTLQGCFTFAREPGFFLPENHIREEALEWSN